MSAILLQEKRKYLFFKKNCYSYVPSLFKNILQEVFKEMGIITLTCQNIQLIMLFVINNCYLFTTNSVSNCFNRRYKTTVKQC